MAEQDEYQNQDDDHFPGRKSNPNHGSPLPPDDTYGRLPF
jgi:hypothetical protein